MERCYGEDLFGWDISGLIETPVLSNVFIAIRWTANLGTYYRSPIPADIYIGGALSPIYVPSSGEHL